MENSIKIVCFTDIVDSTPATERLGNQTFGQLREEFLRVGKLFAGRNPHAYVKDVGDSHLFRFDTIEEFLRVTTRLQQYYKPAPCFADLGIRVKIGAYCGVVEDVKDDVFGSGVNVASRVQGTASGGEIHVDELIKDAVGTVLGSGNASRFFVDLGEHKLKGLPAPKRLFSFKWVDYSLAATSESLAGSLYDHLEASGVVPSNVTVDSLARPAVIIWPVVPRNIITAIHRGQIELIRNLVRLGWSVHVLLSDCGNGGANRSISDAFKHKLAAYLERRQVHNVEFTSVSDMFSPSNPNYDEVHDLFTRVSTELKVADLLTMYNKSYEPSITEKFRNAAALDFIQPPLSIAAVLYIAAEKTERCVVVAGIDEKIQWERVHLLSGTAGNVGVLFNPLLKTHDGYQGKQTKDWPIWYSWQKIVEEMETSNLANWIALLHVFMPSFPSRVVQIAEKTFSAKDMANEIEFPKAVDKEALARSAWSILNPN